ncbi:hypothetical protein NSK11_contig00053-0033 [Nocardia seriolae]|uniref:Uncharacterized protein n=1 Tax=Nocardia seriolae TaxID=37332 RepID=A0ABC9YUV2_9NOCA|nr:hypothetical protein NSERKGN1266_14050 [Nocardia seriolae]BEK98713.1 hypothetical protein NSER024013_66190 [Nocardia seriolae]GAM47390.1 hypothetical protein NS07_v2contig00049-0017 [Nocardia seriolae]GAP29314.1 hypothetical protein NSK11_contig00053-0033 [Nocardia seriolae]GEM24982.1 hypothetical protein NS2_32210 [Nocardia seriolae NBRC 15557]
MVDLGEVVDERKIFRHRGIGLRAVGGVFPEEVDTDRAAARQQRLCHRDQLGTGLPGYEAPDHGGGHRHPGDDILQLGRSRRSEDRGA